MTQNILLSMHSFQALRAERGCKLYYRVPLMMSNEMKNVSDLFNV